MSSHDELMKLTKDELANRIVEMEEAAATEPTPEPRTLRIHSPAGPIHMLTGFVDDGAEVIAIAGLPEDERGHWAPFYTATANGQPLTLERIAPEFEAEDAADADANASDGN